MKNPGFGYGSSEILTHRFYMSSHEVVDTEAPDWVKWRP